MQPNSDGIRRAWERHFAGFTWKGFALIALICLLNGVRRKVRVRIDETLAIWIEELVELSVLGLVVALPIALAVVATLNRIPVDAPRRYPVLALAVLLSSGVGTAAMLAVERLIVGDIMIDRGTPLAAVLGFLPLWLRYAMLGALFTSVYVYARSADESIAQARQAEVDREHLDAQMDEARLQVLQAQIEPHFLFNTLATVRRLYRTSPATAIEMLDNLMRYLSVALPQIRASQSTLGRDVALVEAYLGIQKLRMGRRLAFSIDLPAELHGTPLPPMMLLTLVENAIKHGVSPLPEGGFVRVSANAEHGQLLVRVADSGRGFVQTFGTGTGLANTRARLAALYGTGARLELTANLPRGITATLLLPLAAATRPSSAS